MVLLIANAKGTGPVHLAQDEPHDQLSWCGIRAQFRHVHRDGEIEDVTCPKCLRQIAQGRRLARGGS